MFLLALLLPGASALAQKTDVLVLLNGDTYTGEIKSYDQGRLTLDTAAASWISVKWNHLVSISSDKRYDVETIDGVHHFGQLAPSDPPGKLVIVSGPQTVTVSFLDVFDLAPVRGRFWRRWDGSLDLGFNYTQSSNIVQLNLDADATYRMPKFQLVADLSTFFSRQNQVTAADRVDFALLYDRFLKNRWLLETGVGFNRNVELGLKSRISWGLGGGRNFIQTNQTQLQAYLGASVNREHPVEGESGNNAEAVIGGRYKYFMYDFPKLKVSADLAVYPSLTETGRVRLEFGGTIRRDIISDFYVSLTIFDSFDSKDPTSGEPANDWGPTIAVGWQF